MGNFRNEAPRQASLEKVYALVVLLSLKLNLVTKEGKLKYLLMVGINKNFLKGD